MLKKVPVINPWKAATGVLLIVLLAVVLRTFGDYGMSWDQQYRNSEGTKKLAYYQNLFTGNYKPYDNPEDNYPGFYDLLHQVVNLFQPCGAGNLGLIYSDHLLTGIFGLLTILGAYKIGRQLGGERTGFLSALFLALFPAFYGHMFINPKDIPFACMYIWSLYYTLKLINTPKISAGLIVKLATVYGLTLGVRLGGIFFFGFMGLAFALRLFLKRNEGQLKQKILAYLGLSALVSILAFIVLLPWWPYAHPNPIVLFFKSLFRAAAYPWNGPVYLNGHTSAATDLPWFYLPEMLLITTPLFMTLLGVTGLGLASWSFAKKIPTAKLSYLTPARLSLFFVAFAFFFPILAVIVKHSTLYDGVRHFLFVLAPWAILAGLTAHKLWELCEKAAAKKFSNRWIFQWTMPALLIIYSFSIVREYIQLHPYQYVYFNSLAGGTSKAWQNFDTEYWGTSHREAVKLLSEHLARKNDEKVYKVTSPMAPWLVENFLPANLVYTEDAQQADFFISFMRFNAHMWSDGDIMEDCVVMRQGMPLALVRDRRAIKAKQSQRSSSRNENSKTLIFSILDLLETRL